MQKKHSAAKTREGAARQREEEFSMVINKPQPETANRQAMIPLRDKDPARLRPQPKRSTAKTQRRQGAPT
jgi:hypothetical protein